MEDQILKYLAKSIRGVQESVSNDLSEIRKMVQELAGQVTSSGNQNAMEVERPRQIPDMYESRGMDLERFHGVNPEAWIFQAERYFDFYGIAETHKLSLASFYLDGDALEWFRWLDRNGQFMNWKHFTEKLTIQFQNHNCYVTHSTAKIFKSDFAATLDYDHAHQVFDKFPHKNRCHSHTGLSSDTMKFFTKDGHNGDIDDFKVPELSILARSVFDTRTVAEIAATNIIDEFVEVSGKEVRSNTEPLAAAVSLSEANVITSSMDPELEDGESGEGNDVKVLFEGSNSVVPEHLGAIDLFKGDKYTEEEFAPIIKVVLPVPVSINLDVSKSLSGPSSHSQTLFTITEPYVLSHGTGRHNKYELSGEKLPTGRVLIAQMNIPLHKFYRLGTSCGCHMRAYSNLHFEPEPILGAIPFGSYVDAWFDTRQDFQADFNVLISIECEKFKQYERFTSLSTKLELEKECAEVAKFLSRLFGQPSVCLVPKAAEYEHMKAEFVGSSFPFDPGTNFLTTYLGATQNCVFCEALGSLKLASDTLLCQFALKLRNRTMLEENDIVKIDIGYHIYSAMVVVALMHVIHEGPIIGRAADVIAPANLATEVSRRLVRTGRETADVRKAKVIQKVAEVCDYKIVESVLSYRLKQFVVVGNKVILSVSNPAIRVDKDIKYEALATGLVNNLVEASNLIALRAARIKILLIIEYLIALSEALGHTTKEYLSMESIVVDVLSMEANSGTVARTGRNDTVATEFACEAAAYVARPKLIWLYSNLEDKVLFEDRGIVVNQADFVNAYGLEVVNWIDSVETSGPTKMLESFIWDPGPISNWLKRTTS